jgi:hypothetical protein
MSDFEAFIDPKDLAEFHIAMENLDPDKVIDWRPFLTPLKRELRTYPPPPEGSKYIRTGNLRRNWQYVVHSPKHAELSNMATYAGWVQGVEQAAIHQDRWPVAVSVADTRLTEWVKSLAEKIGRIWIR